MSIVLAIDSAQERCAVAVRAAGRTVAQRVLTGGKGHAEAVLPLVAETLAAAGVGYGDLQLLAATTGPGVFTGVRVGLAAVLGLRIALGIPAVGIGTLVATAATARAEGAAGRILVVNDARRDEVYLQGFAVDGTPEDDVALLPLAEALGRAGAPAVLVGTAAHAIMALLPAAAALCVHDGSALPDAGIVAALAEAAARSAQPPAPRPLYVRAPHITQPRVPGKDA